MVRHRHKEGVDVGSSPHKVDLTFHFLWYNDHQVDGMIPNRLPWSYNIHSSLACCHVFLLVRVDTNHSAVHQFQ